MLCLLPSIFCPALGQRGRNCMYKNKYHVIIPFLAPAVILYLVFVIYP